MMKKTEVRNKFKVPNKQWRRWNAAQRALFNGVYQDITNIGPALFLHPVTVQRALDNDEFMTIAWIAADMLKGKFTTEIVILYENRVIAVDPIHQRAA